MKNTRFSSNVSVYSRTKLFPNSEIEARAMTDEGGPAHTHDYWEMFFFVAGDATHVINGEVRSLKANDLYLLRPEEPHRIDRITPVNEYYLYWNIFISVEEMQRLCSIFNERQDTYQTLLNSTTPLFLHLEKSEMSFFLKLLSFAPKSYYQTVVMNVLCLLLHPTYANLSLDCPSYVRSLYEFINKNCTDREAIHNYLSNMHYSREHISRQFKKYFNKSIRDYIIECKLEYSKSLLLSENNTITNIAAFLDFSCDANFITSFKQYFGITPNRWRKNAKKQE